MVEFNGSGSRAAMSLGVLRVAPRSRVLCSWQSADAVVVNTHWIGRRLWCAGENCEGCVVAPVRSVLYACAMWEHIDTWRPCLIEATVGEVSRLQGFCDMEGLDLAPGLVFEASRAKPRSPLRFEPVRKGGPALEEFAAPRRALAAAAVLAGVPLPAADVSLQAYFERLQPTLNQKLAAAAVSGK